MPTANDLCTIEYIPHCTYTYLAKLDEVGMLCKLDEAVFFSKSFLDLA